MKTKSPYLQRYGLFVLPTNHHLFFNLSSHCHFPAFKSVLWNCIDAGAFGMMRERNSIPSQKQENDPMDHYQDELLERRDSEFDDEGDDAYEM
ncbi:MAG TPA: hypothetical protein VM553_06775 [Dongiaceae bacterium]|nr:hypothetical protein [Dongiaceae bacterium]